MHYLMLDIIRGLAAVWVFLYHLSDEFTQTLIDNHPWFYAFCRRCELILPMFFLISGYGMMGSARRALAHGESTGGYAYRRLLRAYPPLWLAALVAVLVPYIAEVISTLRTRQWVNPPTTYGSLTWLEWLGHLTLVQVFFSHGQALQSAFNRVNSVYWTLALEIQFYLIVFLALAAGRRFHWVILATTALSIPFMMIESMYYTGWFLAYWPMFASGMFLYWLFDSGYEPARLFGRQAFLVAAIGVPMLALGYEVAAETGLYRSNYVWFAPVFLLLTWLARPLDGPLKQFAKTTGVTVLPLRALLILGVMSYSVYLLHAKLMILVAQVARQVLDPSTLSSRWVVIGGTILLCYPFHVWCERPFFRAAPPRPPEPASEPVSVSSSAAAPSLA